MKYCKYHPLVAASHYCSVCDMYTCDCCTDDEKGIGFSGKCFHCARAMTSLGSGQAAIPFWRRLKESFRYPATTDAIILILGGALLMSVIEYFPFAILWWLLVLGALMKYSFACLQSTAEGELEPPNIQEAYEGGVVLILQLLLLSVCVGGTIIKVYEIFGPGLAMFINTLIIASLPAMLINFSLHDNFFSALNPIKNIQLISAVGLPYGVLLAFIMIMFASVGLINELLAHFSSFLSAILQTAVFNFYLIVCFHIMGYMIFQYQDRIGYSVREAQGLGYQPRSELERMLAKIDVNVKEGNYKQVLKSYISLIKEHERDQKIHTRFFNYLCATRDKSNLEKLSNNYFSLLFSEKNIALMYTEYRRCCVIIPTYLPDTAEVRHSLAEKTLESGDFKDSVRLLNGIHRHFPRYAGLATALDTLADALEYMPKLHSNIPVIKALAEKHRQKRVDEPVKQKIGDSQSVLTQDQKGTKPVLEGVRAVARAQYDINRPLNTAGGMSSDESVNTDTSPDSKKPKDLPPIEFKL